MYFQENSDFSYALKFVPNATYNIIRFEIVLHTVHRRLFHTFSVLVLLFAREDIKMLPKNDDIYPHLLPCMY
jgi:hypothetical protein